MRNNSIYNAGRTAIQKLMEEDLEKKWVMRSGDQIILDLRKYEALRHALNQITHHRAQLGGISPVIGYYKIY